MWVGAAIAMQALLLIVIVRALSHPVPDDGDLAAFGTGYRVVGDLTVNCGNGRSHQCGWSFVVEYDGTEADLRDELDRIGVDARMLVTEERGYTRVSDSWWVDDPVVEILVVLALVLGILATLGIGAVIVISGLLRWWVTSGPRMP